MLKIIIILVFLCYFCFQFAQWICYLHHQPCHVVYTDYRPTPLQHYIFPAGGEGIYLAVDELGKFREDNFNTAMAILQDAPEQVSNFLPFFIFLLNLSLSLLMDFFFFFFSFSIILFLIFFFSSLALLIFHICFLIFLSTIARCLG